MATKPNISLINQIEFNSSVAASPLVYSSTQNISSGVRFCSSLNIQSGVTLGVTESFNGYLVFLVNGTATIAGTIDLNGKGAEGGAAVSPSDRGSIGNLGGGGGSGACYKGTDDTSGGAGFGCLGGADTTCTAATAEGGNVGPNAADPAFLIEILEHSGIYPIIGGLNPNGWPNALIGGGGGGTGSHEGGLVGGAGGNGGGVVFIIAKEIIFTGIINCNGADGSPSAAANPGGGGGGGGAVILKAGTWTTDTGTINVNGGLGGVDVNTGGAGGTGISLKVGA